MLHQTVSTARALPVPLREIDSKPAISVVGLGYVGAVSTACLASLGHHVIGVDIDQRKIAQIAAGTSPIHEKDLGRLLAEGVEGALISATDDLVQAVRDSDVTFVSVGTPTAADGGCDTSHIAAAARAIGEGLRGKDGFHLVVMRCSIPPGTTLGFMTPIIEEVSGKRVGEGFGVAFNPEFLREGVAIADFHEPPKTVIGATDERSANILRQIYAPVDVAPILTSVETAEMVKYVDNVWHAAKVCFANEVGRLCRPLGVDSHKVMDVFVQDTKLNLSPYYLKPGFAYGGSCLPKEVRAVAHIAEGLGADLPMIRSLGQSNRAHIDEAVRMVRDSGARRVAVLGLAFKPGTDDLRESPILEVMARLREDGIAVTAHDPAINSDTEIAGQLAYVRHASPGLRAMADDLPAMLRDSVLDAAWNCDTVIVTQARPIYRQASEIALSHGRTVIDLVRLFDEASVDGDYRGIGW